MKYNKSNINLVSKEVKFPKLGGENHRPQSPFSLDCSHAFHYSHPPASETPPPSETKRFFELPQHPLTPNFFLLGGIVLVDK